ncbi:MAG TPA: FAD-binding oxidoreductase, partial [Thermomicrobiales bacterium]|nr:FAD-binding oxidoreductase [Thermomicrobiales bacterium]
QGRTTMVAEQTIAHNEIAANEAVIQDFRGRLRGAALRPDDAGYDEARAVHNGLIDRRPALIVRCSGAADVVEAVNFARDNRLPLSVRGGGHNVAGNAVCDGGLMIDLSLMRGVQVDPEAGIAHAQGGVTWGDLDRETQLFGLATPGGVVSTTGIAGLTLHGGMGHLRRKYGLSLDNLLAVDIVTADGQLRHASAEENPDLFWAARGAGSNFGVVTSFTFRLHPVGPTVMLCAVMYALDDGPAVLRRWRDYIATTPDEFTPLAVFWSVPEGFPPGLVGRPIVILAGVSAGPVDAGERIAQPLRELATPVLDMSGPMPYAAIQSAFDPFFPKGLLQYWKSTYVDALSDDLLDALCDLAATRPSPKTTMDIWPQGGAVGRVRADATAFGPRPPFMVAFESTWTDPADNEANIAWARGAWASMRRFDARGIYLNFPGFGEEKEDLVRAAYGANYPRLQALKSRYDPTDLFRMNLNIRPSV